MRPASQQASHLTTCCRGCIKRVPLEGRHLFACALICTSIRIGRTIGIIIGCLAAAPTGHRDGASGPPASCEALTRPLRISVCLRRSMHEILRILILHNNSHSRTEQASPESQIRGRGARLPRISHFFSLLSASGAPDRPSRRFHAAAHDAASRPNNSPMQLVSPSSAHLFDGNRLSQA